MKKIAAVLLFLSLAVPAFAAKEYKVTSRRLFNVTDDKLTAYLNEQAGEGWRLVSAHTDSANNIMLYLEREKPAQ